MNNVYKGQRISQNMGKKRDKRELHEGTSTEFKQFAGMRLSVIR